MVSLRQVYRSAFLSYVALVPLGTWSLGKSVIELSIANLSLLALVPLFLVWALTSRRQVIDRTGLVVFSVLIAMAAARYFVRYDPLYVTTFLGYLLVFVFAYAFVEGPDDLRRILAAFLVGVTALNVLTALDGLRIVNIVDSPRFNPVGAWQPMLDRTVGVPGLSWGIFGLYNLAAHSILVFCLVGRNLILPRWWVGLPLLALNLMGGFFVQSRSTWFLYLPVTALTLASVYWRFPARRLRVLALSFGALMAVAGVLVVFHEQIMFAVNAVLHMRDYSQRFHNFVAAAAYVRSDWAVLLFGGGDSGFFEFSGSEHIDNQFVNFFVRGGLVAWLAFITVWIRSYGFTITGLAQSLRRRDVDRADIFTLFLLVLMTATLIANFWARISNQKILWILFGAVAAVPLGRGRPGGDVDDLAGR